jgi:formylglycine-generating enzyme required for sulfatase activity
VIAILIGILGVIAPTGRAVEARRPLETTVNIPAGVFIYGSSELAARNAERDCPEDFWGSMRQISDCGFASVEMPERTVWLAGFRIDRVEVTVANYRACVHAGACPAEPLLNPDPRFAAPNLPITMVTWAEANRFCTWRYGRLPTEAEWERAARGQDRRVWPWGTSPRSGASNHGRFRQREVLSPNPSTFVEPDPSDGYGLLAPVGSFPEGASPDGVLDLSGNAAEWTADAWTQNRASLPRVQPFASGTGDSRVVRGGSFRVPLLFGRTTARQEIPGTLRSPEIGFRCAY